MRMKTKKRKKRLRQALKSPKLTLAQRRATQRRVTQRAAVRVARLRKKALRRARARRRPKGRGNPLALPPTLARERPMLTMMRMKMQRRRRRRRTNLDAGYLPSLGSATSYLRRGCRPWNISDVGQGVLWVRRSSMSDWCVAVCSILYPGIYSCSL